MALVSVTPPVRTAEVPANHLDDPSASLQLHFKGGRVYFLCQASCDGKTELTKVALTQADSDAMVAILAKHHPAALTAAKRAAGLVL